MARQYKGVQVRGKSIRIYFNYGGERRFETMEGPKTPEFLEHCERLVESIDYEIRQGTFDYQKYFPKGMTDRFFGYFVKSWLESKRLEVAKSTFRCYESRCENWILPRWAKIDAEQINYRAIQNWTQKELMPKLSNKTIRDVHGLMVQVFRFYRLSTGSTHNPIEGVTIRLSDPVEPDPFTRSEIKKLLQGDSDPQIINLIEFMIWSGARISEAIALAWEDVDLEKGVIIFKRARVASRYKVTKTRRSTRKVKLLRPAVQALYAQARITMQLPAVKVAITQRDNRSQRDYSLRFCFHNPNTGQAFSTADNFRNNFWNPLVKRAGVRHRGPNQCRHTFASQMLSSGAVTVDWVANQLGHTSSQMIWRHYGKWIPEDEANIIGVLEEVLELK
ncbi:integrase [Thiopseudomonas alkaliphila]|nr:integrase [Thiopseudomonas alkaliphila]